MKTDKKTQTTVPVDISKEERELLDDSFENDLTSDNKNLKKAMLDNTDDEGELLNEVSSATDVSGKDLDIPGSDDEDEITGEEDEENSGYSEADTE